MTTELAARGLDIPRLTHVVNLDLPTDAAVIYTFNTHLYFANYNMFLWVLQHYVHRAGRVGRTGRAGVVISFATTKTLFVMNRFAHELKVSIRRMEVFAKQLLLMPETE